MASFCGMSSSLSTVSHGSLTSSEDNRGKRNGSSASLSPFSSYQDGYKWPNLYEEVDEMMEQCILIWPMAELRQRYREHKVEDTSGSIMKLPLTSKEIAQVIDDNVRLFAKFTAERSDRPRNDIIMEKLDTIHRRRQRQRDLNIARSGVTRELNNFTILHLDDRSDSEELVYWMALDHKRRRLTVTFRGAGTKMDWVTASEIYMKEVSNPMKSQQTLKIHNGFHEYMFSPSSRGAKGPNGEDLSEYEEILRQHVIPELKKYPGYKVRSENRTLFPRQTF